MKFSEFIQFRGIPWCLKFGCTGKETIQHIMSDAAGTAACWPYKSMEYNRLMNFEFLYLIIVASI